LSNAASQAYKIDTNGQAVSFGTALTSSGGTFAKSGTGTLTLNAANTYTGATSVTGGTLIAGVTNALPTGTALSLSGGNFKLAGTSLTQQVSSISLTGNSTIVVQLQANGTTIGKIDAASITDTDSNAGKTLEVDLVGGVSNFTVNQSFQIFTNGGSYSGLATKFSNFILPAGYVWNTSTLSTTGSITVAAIPEPGPLLLGVVGLATVAALKFRKKKKLAPVAV